MRCPDCSKFVSVEMGEVEVDAEVTNEGGSGHVTGSIRIALQCGDCSTELKSSSFDLDETIELEHSEECAKDDDLELDFAPESCDFFIPPAAKRQKHMYGAEGTMTVSCNSCGAKADHDWKDSIQSSHMEES